MIVLRRFLVLAALMFWQGGFTFYAAVVVPVGQHLLGHTDQGFITRQVTWYLNLTGTVALVLLAWDTAAARDPSIFRRRGRWLAWGGMLVTLGALVWLHPRLDALLDPEQWRVLDRRSFRTGHRWYLWISTVQWGCGVGYAVASIGAWRAADAAEKVEASADVAAGGAQKNVPPLIPSASPSHRSHHSAGQQHHNQPG